MVRFSHIYAILNRDLPGGLIVNKIVLVQVMDYTVRHGAIILTNDNQAARRH